MNLSLRKIQNITINDSRFINYVSYVLNDEWKYDMVILGISAFYHDSASCIIKDGKIIAAAQEERFTRKKHDQEFPMNSIK